MGQKQEKIERTIHDLIDGKKSLNIDTVAMATDLNKDDESDRKAIRRAGRLRSIIVHISHSSYIPLDNPFLLKEIFELFIEKFNLIVDPFEQSFFSLVYLSYMQIL